MFYNAKNGCLDIDGTTMYYLSFGKGTKNLIMIPGLGDGLKTAKGMAIPFSIMYKRFAKDYRVHVFSRKNELKQGCTTRDMATDLKTAMELLGIEKADIVGVSQGGMIAQHFAVDYPERVGKLVLVVTASRPNECIENTINEWIEMAKRDDYRELMLDNIKKMYTDEYIAKNKWMLSFAGKFGKPSSFERFIIMAEACISHDCFESLHLIKAPTLVIGGEKDAIVTAQASRDIAAEIKGSRLLMYEDYGHSLYEEAKDFNEVVKLFLMNTPQGL